MDDLDRLVGTLVRVLEQADPKRARTPFQVSELYHSIIPYRRYKNQLQFDTNQDYEMAVLRLLAGEGNYVSVEPAEVQQQLADEARAVNPDPSLFREFAAARVLLQPHALESSLEQPTDSYAPPRLKPEAAQAQQGQRPPSASPSPMQVTPAAKAKPPIFEAVEEAKPKRAPTVAPIAKPAAVVSVGCPACSQALPQGRAITFCPFCGERIGVTPCDRCGEEIEPGWRFCVTCGTTAGRA